MTVRLSFRRLPPFPIPSRSRFIENLPCIPCITERGSHPTYFAEFYMMLGPQAVGDPRDNTLPDLIGREWAFLFCDNNEWYLLQWVGAEHLSEAPGLISPGWALIGEPLLSLPGDLACGTQRRFSAAFDQSARLVVAYEQSETIFLTRWDPAINQYVQNVTFAGHDPVVVFDATWAYDVPVSDVLVFYLDAETRSKLMCRVQRDIYAIAYELHDYGQPVVLDRVTRLPLRYQVLASDANGDPLEDAGERFGLLSDLYPYLARDPVAGLALPGTEAEYLRVVIPYTADTEAMLGTASPTVTGAYAEPIIFYDAADSPDPLDGLATVTVTGTYAEAVLEINAGQDDMSGTASATTSGDYEQVVVSLAPQSDDLTGLATTTVGGSYDPA